MKMEGGYDINSFSMYMYMHRLCTCDMHMHAQV